MAILSNINGKFAVDSTGAVQFSGVAGTSGQILKSNGNSSPTWVDASTVIGGPYLPLSGGTLTGATSTASGISFTVGGILTTDKILVVKGQNLAHVASSVIISQESTTKSQIRFYGANTSTAGSLEFLGSTSNASSSGVRMLIDSSGNVGIGRTAPDYKLVISNSNAEGIELGPGYTAGKNLYQNYNRTTSAYVEEVHWASEYNFMGAGNFGIGTASPAKKLEVATTGINQSSTIRIQGTDGNGNGHPLDLKMNARGWSNSIYSFIQWK